MADSYKLLGVSFEAIRWCFYGMSTFSDSKRELCGARNYRREIQKKKSEQKIKSKMSSYKVSLLMGYVAGTPAQENPSLRLVFR